MELTPGDQKVIDLLSKLKNSNSDYPSDILTARRQTYLKQIANIGLGIGISTGLKNATKNGNGAGAAGIISSKILETVLIAAIAVEVGTAAYLYRGKLANLIRTYTGSSTVQEIAPSTIHTSSSGSDELEVTATPRATSTEIPTYTPVPPLFINSNPNNNHTTGSGNSGISATPKPNDNNGNHYGQTPKPVRTKENNNTGGNNTDGSNNNGNDKTHKP